MWWRGLLALCAAMLCCATVVAASAHAANHAPVCEALNVELVQGSTNVEVGRCTDEDGDAFGVAIAAEPEHGTADALSTGYVTYTPDPGYHGPDHVSFYAGDELITGDEVTVNLTVLAPPTCTAGPVDVPFEAPPVQIGACSDAENDPLTLTITAQPEHGTAEVSGHTIVYAPARDWRGPDSVSFKANDGTADSTEATATINVLNAEPYCLADADPVKLARDAAATRIGECGDVNGDPVTVAVTVAPAHGTTSIVGSEVRYTPAAGYTGSDTLKFRADDGMNESYEVTATIFVDAPPTCTGGAVGVPFEAVATQVGSCADPENDPLTITITGAPAHGTTSIVGSEVRYTPAAGYHGSDSVTFRADDGMNESPEVTATVTVAAAPETEEPKAEDPKIDPPKTEPPVTEQPQADPPAQQQPGVTQQQLPVRKPATVAAIVAPSKIRVDRLGRRTTFALSGLKPTSNVALRVRIKTTTIATLKATVAADGKASIIFTLTKAQRRKITKKVKQLTLRYSYTTEDGVKHVFEPVLKLTR